MEEILKVSQVVKTNLSIPLRQEELFLEVFEDEWLTLKKFPKTTQLLADTRFSCLKKSILIKLSVISEISQTPMSGQVLIKRLPCGADEQLQYEILLFFLLRQLSIKLKNEQDVELPLACPNQLQKVGAKLDLNNAELIGCTVTTNDSSDRRFMVVDTYQIILVEPDSKLGWGKVTFAGQLQDLEIEQLSQDERTLVITVRQSFLNLIFEIKIEFQKLTFDDHIRSLTARQRLTKGRLRARHLKLQKISAVLDLPDPFASSSNCSIHRPGHAKVVKNQPRSSNSS
ncbi:unnamed protein product [Oikopleura dioica]|nr:unnamed protein product [Oikopleura dioica]